MPSLFFGENMKKILKSALPLFAAAIMIISTYLIFSAGGGEVYAAGYYDYYYEQYALTYDVNADLTMTVTEDFTVRYTGTRNTGILRDIPVNAGDRVRNVRCAEIIDGETTAVEYAVESEYSGFITVDIGDTSYKSGQTHRYLLTYEYAVTKPTSETTLSINAVGFGYDTTINDVSVTITLPDGFKDADCYVGELGTTSTSDYQLDGNTITLQVASLPAYNGVTFDLHFGEGVLSTKIDITPYIIVIVGCLIIGALVVLKLLKFNRGGITVVPNFDACDRFDPLSMGKLIDNTVDSSDITSLIFYWANKGYLKIDMTNPDDIVLIRQVVAIPSYMPHYQKYMFDNLFLNAASVRVSSLKNKFYRTVEIVTREVDSIHCKMYDTKSTTVSLIFALIGGLLMSVTPLIMAIATINITFLYMLPFFMLIPAFIVYTLTRMVYERSGKLKKRTCVLLYLGIAFVSLVISIVYALIVVPSYIIEPVPKVLLCLVGFAIIMLSVSFIMRTPEYEKVQGDVIGFKEFITDVEKEKLEEMLETNPELYYKILPYAQVLGVSDIWEEKFKDLTVAPPQWATGYTGAFDYLLFCAALHSINNNMSSSFVSRPSSSGLSGGGSGSFGGRGGGGHGGGGSRGR